MEALRGLVNKQSCDLGLGVKSQSNLVIANSCRNWPQSNPDRDCCKGRETDLGFRARKGSVLCPTPNFVTSQTSGDRKPGVSLASERGTTQTAVKVPKYQLSAKGMRVSSASDSKDVGLEAATV